MSEIDELFKATDQSFQELSLELARHEKKTHQAFLALDAELMELETTFNEQNDTLENDLRILQEKLVRDFKLLTIGLILACVLTVFVGSLGVLLLIK